jgi:hypothetical protein
VIVSASRGQYLKPGSDEPGFFSYSIPCSGAGVARSASTTLRIETGTFARLDLESKYILTVIARSIATKQSSLPEKFLDCFAEPVIGRAFARTAMTEIFISPTAAR